MLQSVTDGCCYATEVNDLSQDISRNGVHAVYFQPVQPAAVSFVVYPVVEGTHQQEAKSAGKKRHAACPQPFDDGHLQAPYQREGYQGYADYQQGLYHFPVIILACFHYLSGKSSQHHGSPESEAAPDPGVVVVSREAPTAVFIPEHSVAEMPQYQPVHLLGKVSFRSEVAQEGHRYPVDQ